MGFYQRDTEKKCWLTGSVRGTLMLSQFMIEFCSLCPNFIRSVEGFF
jgi:hypothetical protein